MSNKDIKKTSIGGQAIIEGVMMRGPYKTAMAVRKSDNEIILETNENGTKNRNRFWKLPIIRGCVGFIDSLVIGMKALMFSADQVDLEDEEESESKFDKWLEDKFGDNIKDIVIYVSIAISLIFSVVLFLMIPTLTTRGISWILQATPFAHFAQGKVFISVVEGILKLSIFIGYLALVSRMKDIRRVFEYHGAEHKTIACYEHGEELTVENVRKFERFHPRCGTSFLLFVIIVSIVLAALLPRTDVIVRILMKLLLLPLVAGISYEIIKWAGRGESTFVRWLSKPGLWLQKLTTREPDDSQIEVAIKSMQAVIPDKSEDDEW